MEDLFEGSRAYYIFDFPFLWGRGKTLEEAPFGPREDFFEGLILNRFLFLKGSVFEELEETYLGRGSVEAPGRFSCGF